MASSYKTPGWRGARQSLQVQFDEASLLEVRKLELWPAVFTAFCELAMEQTVEGLMGTADTLMPTPSWSTSGRSTGDLESSLGGAVISPWKGRVFTKTPYAQRVEYSFTGMTDSLGRYYAAWPADPYSDYYGYFTRSIEVNLPQISDQWYAAGVDAAAAVGFVLI